MLGEDFRGCHDAGLIAVVQCDERGHQCYKGLPRPHVALKEAVHLAPAFHICMDFTDDPLLCLGECEGEMVVVEAVEIVTHMAEHVPSELSALVAGVA